MNPVASLTWYGPRTTVEANAYTIAFVGQIEQGNHVCLSTAAKPAGNALAQNKRNVIEQRDTDENSSGNR